MSAPIVFIDGDQGTTGLQIHDRLRDRTDIRLFTLAAAERKDSRRRAEAINACDIAILCLPDAAARRSGRHRQPCRPGYRCKLRPSHAAGLDLWLP